MSAPATVPMHAEAARPRPWRVWPRVLAVASAIALLCGAGLLYHVDPADGQLPRCPFQALTSWHCAGCGSTRAMHALLHGDIAAAVRFNPLTLPALCVLGYAYARWLRRTLVTPQRAHAGEHFGARTRPAVILSFAAAVCVFWIARNVPVYPLTLLAPPAPAALPASQAP